MKFSTVLQIFIVPCLLLGTPGCVGVVLTPIGSPPPSEQAIIPSADVSTDTPMAIPVQATATSAPTGTPTQIPPTACPRQVCTIENPFPFALPIALPGRDTVEPSYRFGSTQNGQREPHHGVEFINKAGTPVLAAADGKVVVAGDDSSAAFGPYVDFYGNLVVIKHELPGVSVPVYTLYGHLLKVMVSKGDKVKQGEQIGEVGLGGVAAGTHLHFEVRYGENTYSSVRNPELWLQPHLDETGQSLGVLAGRIVNAQGELLGADNIVIKKLDEKGKATRNYFLLTYEEPAMLGLAPLYDSFAIGDLPAGTYQISFIYKHEQKVTVTVAPGVVTYVYLRGE
jgi:murein DD-endopeptidase MepM/ murein hydrolase activator NlpD